ncbi:unnamed protein product [Pleuronectes platessa]|uniref:Uncharacterized protein n=1 Tax=Pleuronectes platessa TaxID=8262 RepID=A0A9N7UAI4_PLEPL|nr:unnamed protein product [Pleuronectes platessa]
MMLHEPVASAQRARYRGAGCACGREPAGVTCTFLSPIDSGYLSVFTPLTPGQPAALAGTTGDLQGLQLLLHRSWVCAPGVGRCSTAVDWGFGFPPDIEPLLFMFGRYVTGSRFADGAAGQGQTLDGRWALLSGLSTAVRRLLFILFLPWGSVVIQACQVKNANELFRHVLHMINVAGERAHVAAALVGGAMTGSHGSDSSREKSAASASLRQPEVSDVFDRIVSEDPGPHWESWEMSGSN